MDQTVLLLVGRTGNGKSSTRNSILRSNIFTPHGVGEQVSAGLHDKGEVVQMTVVNGTGIGDPQEDLIGGESAAINSCDSAFNLCKLCFTAILFVLKFGVRFTKQEKDAVHMIKFLFGDDVFKKWGIIVMTYGDNFVKDGLGEDIPRSFKSWCDKQGGDFKSVYEECDKRCVLFSNRAIAEKQNENQVRLLFDVLKKLEHGPYTEGHFNTAVSRRPKQHIDPIKVITEKVNRFIQHVEGDYNQLVAELEKLKRQQEDSEVIYQIDVLTQKLRITQGPCAFFCGCVNLVYLYLSQKCLRLVRSLRNKLRRGNGVKPFR